MVVLSVIGTRPEAIKMAPVVRELNQHPRTIRSLVCVTGQHRQMLDQVLSLFGIRPDFDLNLMMPDQGLAQITASSISALDRVVAKCKPDWVLAQGDTSTVLAAALVSFYRRVRFGHVEAGLRTGDLTRPFPEEMNRCLADALATIYFAPTERARQALLAEGVNTSAIHVTGNTVIDALLQISRRSFNWRKSPVPNLDRKRLVLITAHRRESFGKPFRELCYAIRDLAERFSTANVQFVYPVHLNPNVQEPVMNLLSGLENVTLVEPVDYLCMAHLMKRAELILTDSGGIQEEAPTFGVPVLVMRDTTERPEGVESGMVRLVGTGRVRIVEDASHLLQNSAARLEWPRGKNPYGDGKAAARIVSTLLTVADND